MKSAYYLFFRGNFYIGLLTINILNTSYAYDIPYDIIFNTESLYLKGSIKKMIISKDNATHHYTEFDSLSYDFDTKGMVTNILSYIGFPSQQWKYSPDGLLSQHESFLPDSKGVKRNLRIGNVQKYNENKLPSLIFYTSYTETNTIGGKYAKEIYSIDYLQDAQTHKLYNIDKSGAQHLSTVKTIYFFPGSNKPKKIESQTELPFSNGFASKTDEYSLNGLAKVTSERTVRIFTYDNGVVTRETEKVPETNKIILEFQYKDYVFDDCKNWIKRTIVDSTGSATDETRIISYYKPCSVETNK